jgi:signal transduction histidine kinase
MAQTPDGYLWLGGEFGLFRFDGVHAVRWQSPAGQNLPDQPYSLLVTRDGTLWIGTFTGLASLSGGKLTQYPEVGKVLVTSLLEDQAGTVWAGTVGGSPGTPTGRLCAIRSARTQCYLQDGAFGSFVWGLSLDGSGHLWAGAESGLWRWAPGPPRHYPAAGMRISDLNRAEDGQLIMAANGAGLKEFIGNKLEPYQIRDAGNPNKLLRDRDVDSNKLLRDRDGGLWIGTVERGLIHLNKGRTDVYTKSDGLTGDIVLSIFEDREANIWVATTGGLDRFRQLPVSTISVQQGLSSDATSSVLAAADGSIWAATHDGLTRWKNGGSTIFRRGSGLPDDFTQSLFQDYQGRIWVFTAHGLAYFKDGKFVAVNAVPSKEVYSIAGDQRGNLWLSGNQGLSHLLEGRLLEHFPWPVLGRHQQAKVVVCERGGVWLSFWIDGGVLFFNDGQVRTSYTAADGFGKGHVPGLRLDSDGALWAATEEGGLSRIKNGRIATLTTRNGLPCNTIHWSTQDHDGSLWMYAACGLVRITGTELGAWVADPTHRVQATTWDAADGVRLRSVAASSFGPTVAESNDGKLWFLTGGGIQVVDPHHLVVNKLPPPVRVEQIVADKKLQWQNVPGEAVSKLRLPARTRDLTIDYTALSLVAPEKVHFRYKLEGQDSDWREVVNERQVQYSNLGPGNYTFRVMACNNSGIWNEQGDTLEFSVAPAYYQTTWFRALCVAAFMALLWVLYQLRVRQLATQFNMRLEERVGERTRIARDLHDTLLQSFHGILLHFQTGINLLPEGPGEARKTLEKAMDQAKHAIVEGREAIQGLRSSVVETNDLALAMRTLGEELAAGSNSTAFQVQVEGTPRDLHPILRDEVYRITGEGMRNAFHHAEAKQIEVEIHYDERRVRVRVRDDGKGIDPKLLSDDGREGHFGLRGMRERAKLIGGKLTVWSELDAGTELELSIPAARAYTAPTDGQGTGLAEKLFAKLSGGGTAKKP